MLSLDVLQGPLLVLAAANAVLCAVMAGFFFAFSTSVMGALDQRPPAEGIAAMQAINAVVLNPVFFALFFGTALLTAGAGVGALLGWALPGAAYWLAGSLVYLTGSFGLTAGLHVPMNERLADLPADATSSESTDYWALYLRRWTRWNHVRAVASLLAAVLFAAGYGVHASA